MSKVELYTKGYCPYCHRAKALLEEKGVAFEEYRIDQNPDLRDTMITRANGGYTVPQIFIDDKHIGGCDDMYALESQNKLDNLLSV
ncbi:MULTISPECIES: glutaredoxin 3 [Alteromonadaceae]|uniref:glutaredoxin 3 n=1 Tax=Alteromonadaceae TaxID=72275 RepID=UPI001C08AF70|nr:MULTISPECIES: glutaredoxin 3 [Aliiglaciecola]MBU2878508.1 glutaredoxin 3 [Aliiglaciecola lipolytica]MDO6709664.1 glutaredoxin 3 [Aliiglaciecola sp. 2_MG-2023]MDO6750794.1 glutaredoxin 3 [Aliiglaciecola sp. 1_MG-2023]